MRLIKNLKRLIFISRPAGWLPFACPYIAGVILADADWSFMTWLGAFFCTFPMGVVVFGLNDIADKKSDVINARKGGAAGAIVASNETRFLVWASLIISVVFEAAYLLSGHYLMALWTLGILAFAYTYSVPPIRLKTRPVLDGLSNGFWGLFILMSGFTASVVGFKSYYPHWRLVFLAVLTGAAFHVLFTVADYEVDKKVGDTTIAVYLGKIKTLAVCEAIFIADLYLTRHSSEGLRSFFLLCVLCTLAMIYRPTAKFTYRVTGILVLLMPILFAYLVVKTY
ncbi:MAG TPA: UbiA family prenyltransferase [Candidatus Saccharimonadales bacterium]|nr:UbiA family prenyltransferase [Candidatus Saccharimonadales bacterium]